MFGKFQEVFSPVRQTSQTVWPEALQMHFQLILRSLRCWQCYNIFDLDHPHGCSSNVWIQSAKRAVTKMGRNYITDYYY